MLRCGKVREALSEVDGVVLSLDAIEDDPEAVKTLAENKQNRQTSATLLPNTLGQKVNSGGEFLVNG